MAVAGKSAYEPVTEFEDWYTVYSLDQRTGQLSLSRGASKQAEMLWQRWEHHRREHDKRVALYHKYETMADAEVVSKKPDLPNVSSGDIAGMVRRVARNVVQNTPNVEVVCEFDDDSPKGIFARHVLKTKIIGDDLNSNEMQQNLFAAVVSSFTLGFQAVVPVLCQKADKTWAMEFDTIHYRDFIPEPGVKDARKSPEVFIRRYLTKGELVQLIRTKASGWDIAALKTLCETRVPPRQRESVSHQDQKHHTIPDGYEVITWYSASGDPFLTFDANQKLLLRIERNTDPLKRHPVQMLVLEKDPQQPLGKSQISLVYGRQEFQDLMLNGAMKLWYKNINPTLLGYGTGLNGIPNMSPGKYVPIPNPNARVEPFEVNTQTLLQYNAIAQANMGSMVNLVGAADQQMAASAGGGMSATPQGVEAQEAMVDITTNNYQKAVENFFSMYCSYALTVYFQEMKNTGQVKPSADTRRALIKAGVPADSFDDAGNMKLDMSDMAVVYNVRCVPGSLVELEDEKQLRILQEIFVPLSQAMPALAATGDEAMLKNAAMTMQYILGKTIELSGSASSKDIKNVFDNGMTPQLSGYDEQFTRMEDDLGGLGKSMAESNAAMAAQVEGLAATVGQLMEANTLLLEKLGVTQPASTPVTPDGSEPATPAVAA